MADVRTTTHLCDDAVDAGSGGQESGDSIERTESVPLSDVGSHSRAGASKDESASTRSYFFGPSTVTVSHIRGMIHNGYFAEGMGREPREEIMLEHQPNKAVAFEEFFTAGLQMPPHIVLSDILLKFRVQLHQLTPNAIFSARMTMPVMWPSSRPPTLLVVRMLSRNIWHVGFSLWRPILVWGDCGRRDTGFEDTFAFARVPYR
jgi:hypothetical protein